MQTDPATVEILGRESVARHYLKGNGIEIGALHNPLKVPADVSVRYVDRISEDGLRQQYPELITCPLVHVDVIDNGESLGSFETATVDFVIANHFLEHSQDPIGTLKNMLRVLRPGGVIYLAIPDKRFSFDRERPITTLQHLIDDHQNGPAGSKRGHFEEFVKYVSLAPDEGHAAEVKRLMELDYSIHFHVWDKTAITEFLNQMQDSLGFDLVFNMQNGGEVLNVLQKRS